MMEDYSIICSESEYESLLEEIAKLKERVARLTAFRDDLVYHICPSLRSEYEEKIASLERELLAGQLYLREMQRIIEILQAQMNQGQEPSMREAEEQAGEEYRKYQEDLNEKAKKAEEEQKRWKKESNWYEYDEGYSNRQEDPYGEAPEDSEDADDDASENHKSRSEAGDSGQKETDKTGSDRNSGSAKHNHGGNEGPGQDEHSENAYDGDSDSGHGGKQSKAAELKRLYRKIVKLLHPDVHPNQTPREKELLNMAIQAYDRGDLDAMLEIWEELTGSGVVQEEETFDDSPDGIVEMKETVEKLKKRCEELDKEIRHIRSEYPYTMKSFLDDEDAVAQKQAELREEINKTRETNRQLEEYIKELKKQMGSR